MDIEHPKYPPLSPTVAEMYPVMEWGALSLPATHVRAKTC